MNLLSINGCLKAAFFLCLGPLFSCTKDEGLLPRQGAITESVYASGHVKAKEQYNVVSTAPGIVTKIHRKVGDHIRKGDILFSIKNPAGGFMVQNSQYALERAEENLKKIDDIRRQVDLARVKYAQDSLMYARQKKLREQNIGTQVQLEQLELALKASKTDFENARAQLRQAQKTLELDYKTAKNNVKISKENADVYSIRSETDGKVYSISPEEGEGVNPQAILAVIGKEDSFLIEIQVDENDIAKLQLGQEVFVTMDSYKDSLYKAKVSKIHPIMNINTGSFTVEGIFTKAPPRLYPNLNLEANIWIGRKENALVIPREYLLDDDYVLLENKEKKKVKVGLVNFESVEILGGLESNQKILKP